MATKASLALGPHIPPDYLPHHAAGFKAMQRGDATPHQQQECLKWLIERAAGTYEFHFYPGDRETAFALGRAFVGQQIVKLLNLDLALLRRNDHVDPTRKTDG